MDPPSFSPDTGRFHHEHAEHETFNPSRAASDSKHLAEPKRRVSRHRRSQQERDCSDTFQALAPLFQSPRGDSEQAAYTRGLTMEAKFTTASAYPSERAFVLQFHREADLKIGRFLGRIEHVSSGRVGHFQSPEELVAFAAEYVPPQDRAERGQEHD